MTDIEWGPAIAVDGKRPGWLCGGEWRRVRTLAVGEWQTADIESPGDTIPDMDEWNWGDITAIRLPADHPHYRQPVQEKGLIIPAGMVPWHGGQKPTDWSGKAVMFRNGEIRYAPAGAIWKMGWDHSYGMGDIVAYSVDAPQADTKPDVTAGVTEDQRQAVFALCEAAAALNVATDGFERMRSEREAVVAALKSVRDAGVLLPEPVDPDEQYARDLIREQGWSGEREIGSEAVVAMIVKARRELALAGETGK